jgi:hypothetical protein
MAKSRRLTPQQLRFVEEYVYSENATQAYRQAYPEAKYTTCRTEGPRLLAKPAVAAEVARRLEELRQGRAAANDAYLGELAFIIGADIGDVLNLSDPDRPRLHADIGPEARRAIKGIRMTKHGVAVVMHDKIAAIREFGIGIGARPLPPLDQLLKALPDDAEHIVRRALEAYTQGADARPPTPPPPAPTAPALGQPSGAYWQHTGDTPTAPVDPAPEAEDDDLAGGLFLEGDAGV